MWPQNDQAGFNKPEDKEPSVPVKKEYGTVHFSE